MPVFLFTDIEGSTRLWENHPDEMRLALARHDDMLRVAVETNKGSVVKTTGDGILAVFEETSDALRASVAAQQKLADTDWGTTGPIRVRMGIHTGDAEERNGDFFGPSVNKAARIMASGHGGQVLVSERAASTTAVFPEGMELMDLGVHRLKDLAVPEHLFQLLHDGLLSDFPPPTTLDSRPNNLPTQVSQFFGREDELAAIREMLNDPIVRLVTLTGPGGAGKTRLAIQVAAEAAEDFADGVCLVDIAQERQPQAVYEAMVRAIGISGAGDGEALQALKTRLRDREQLIVLDNFEQVTQAASGVVELLQACPRLKVIATSREALKVRAERIYPVPPLGLPPVGADFHSVAASEAVQLFVDRARAVHPDFEPTEDDMETVAELCRMLDGLPLAIELAAARLNVFSPSELVDRLNSRLDLVGGGSRDLPERQRTLINTIDWSYDLLDKDERRAFQLMSLFTSAKMTAFESVATDLGFPDPVESLSSLVDKSLVRSDASAGGRRFSMLRTIREYAAEDLAEDAELDLRARNAHAVYYTARAQELRSGLRGPQRHDTLAELEADNGNLRSTWHHWVEVEDLEKLYALLDGLWALLEAKGWYHTAIELAGDLLSLISTLDPTPELAAEEITLRTSLARALMSVYGWGSEVEETFREIAVTLEKTDASAVQRFPVLRALASYYLNVMQLDKAIETGRQILELAEAESDSAMEVEGLFVVGASTMFLGSYDDGLAMLDEVIARFDPTRHGSSRFRLGPSPGVVAGFAAALTRWVIGELEVARSQASSALELARRLDHPISLAYALYHFGYFSFLGHRYDATRACATELEVVARTNDYPIWQALSEVLDGIALTGLDRVDEGFQKTETGIVLYQDLNTPPVFWPMILGLRAIAAASAGDPERGLSLVDEAIQISGGMERNPDLGVTRGVILCLGSGNHLDEAAASFRTSAGVATQLGLRMTALQALTKLVQLNRTLGVEPDASDELLAVYRTFPGGLDEQDLVVARGVLGLDPD